MHRAQDVRSIEAAKRVDKMMADGKQSGEMKKGRHFHDAKKYSTGVLQRVSPQKHETHFRTNGEACLSLAALLRNETELFNVINQNIITTTTIDTIEPPHIACN